MFVMWKISAGFRLTTILEEKINNEKENVIFSKFSIF